MATKTQKHPRFRSTEDLVQNLYHLARSRKLDDNACPLFEELDRRLGESDMERLHDKLETLETTKAYPWAQARTVDL